MIEERRAIKGQTFKRNLNMVEYQPRRLVPQNKIELGMPRNSWTPHRDTVPHEMYPIPEDEENRSNHQQTSIPGRKETTSRKEGSTGGNRDLEPPTRGGQNTGGSAGAPGGGGGDEPSDSSGDDGPNRNGDADSEEENESIITSARLRGHRGRPGPVGP